MIDPGTVISVSVSAMTAVGFVWAIKSSVAVLDVRLAGQDRIIGEIKEELKKLISVGELQAVQNQRQDTFESTQLMQGSRLDRFEERFNKWVDQRGAIS